MNSTQTLEPNATPSVLLNRLLENVATGQDIQP